MPRMRSNDGSTPDRRTEGGDAVDNLISRAAAIEAALDGADYWDGGYSPERERCIREHMANVPSVDAVPVIRCRDCKHSIENAKHIDVVCERSYDPDFYCAAGERNDSE